MSGASEFICRVSGAGCREQTRLIQRQIDAAGVSGGTVCLPAGEYTVGTLRLKSGVRLHLCAGAVLRGSPDIGDYEDGVHHQRYAGEAHMDRCLLFAKGQENITLDGEGTLDGNGEAAFPLLKEDGSFAPRPMLLRLLECRNIRLSGLCLRNAASWTTAFLDCSGIVVHGVSIDSSMNHGNGDGLDFDNCTDVAVSGCRICASDDCICLQNSNPALECRNITVTGCILSSRWAGIRIGLLSRGRICDAVFSNLILHDCGCSAVKIQLCEGGVLSDLCFSGLSIANVPRPVMITANFFGFGADYPGPVPHTGQLCRICFDGIRARWDLPARPECEGIIVCGLPGYPVRDVTFSDVLYRPFGGPPPCGTKAAVPELQDVRPEYFVWKNRLPASGFYLRHTEGCRILRARIEPQHPAGAPPVVREDDR